MGYHYRHTAGRIASLLVMVLIVVIGVYLLETFHVRIPPLLEDRIVRGFAIFCIVLFILRGAFGRTRQ